MVWCHQNKLIFVHIPKTGGTSVEEHLKLSHINTGLGLIRNFDEQNMKALHHFTWLDYQKFLGQDVFHKYTTFSIVRNPVERCISEYYWTPLDFGYKNGRLFDDFLSNVERIVKEKRFYDSLYHDHFQTQTSYVMDKNNKLMVDKLFRFEDFEEVERFLSKYCDSKLSKVNKRSENVEKIKPSKEQIQRIEKIYHIDFVNFEYPKS